MDSLAYITSACNLLLSSPSQFSLERIGIINGKKRTRAFDDDLSLATILKSGNCNKRLKLAVSEPVPVKSINLKDNAQSPKKKRARSKNNLTQQSEILCNFYGNSDFKGHFGIARSTVEYVIKRFGEDILGKRATTGRPPSNVTYHVLLSLWTLTNRESFEIIANRFNVSKSQAHRMFTLFCDTVTNSLYEEIAFPSNIEELLNSCKSFQDLPFKTMPKVVGCLGSTFVPLRGLREESIRNESKKGLSSIILQGVCDGSMCFLDIFVRWPSEIESPYNQCAQTWCNSNLHEKLVNKNVLGDYYLVANSKFPLEEFLMTPYGKPLVVQGQINYNEIFESTESIIKNCFAALKYRFKRLEYLDTMKIDFAIKTISTACVLHNLCIKEGDSFNSSYVDPNPINNDVDCEISTENGEAKRGTISHLL